MSLPIIATTVVLVSLGFSLVQANCTPPPPNTLIGGVNKGTNNVPVVSATSNTLQPVVGGQSVDAWSMFSVTQVQQNGLWCQVNENSNAGMGNNIGDWFYPTASGFTLVPNDGSTPYQSLKCTNQIGLVVDGNVTNNQGIVKCNTTISNLDTSTNHWVVYSDNVYNNYSGPSVEPTMMLSILSKRDAESDLLLAFTFMISSGPPSRIQCTNGITQIFSARGNHLHVNREVLRSQYSSSSQPDMTRVRVTLPSQPRIGRTYTCTVTVEGRVNIATGSYDFVTLGTGSSTLTVTVAGTPTSVTARRVALTGVTISWIAPSPAPNGYEVFYQEIGGSRFSGGATSNTEWTLAGLTLGKTYDFFVVAYGGMGVLPSARSNLAVIVFTIPQLTTVLNLAPTSSSITVSWALPQYTPDSYNLAYSCRPLCGSQEMTGAEQAPNGASNMHTISFLPSGSHCIVNATAVFGTDNSNTITAATNTKSAAPTGAPEELTSTSVESRSLTLMWGTVPCSDQNGPITGYSLRYSNGTSIADTTGEGSREYKLNGLTPYTRYSTQVAAINTAGTGPYSGSPLMVETLQDIPGPVSSLSANPEVVQLNVSWNPPNEPNGIIIAYEVGFGDQGSFKYTNTSATWYTLRGFSPNTIVSFQVRAYTKIGPGKTVSSQVSTGSVPRPTDVKAILLNHTAVVVTWTPVNLPVVHYCNIATYTITGARRRQMHSGNVTLRSCEVRIVSGLKTGQQYQFIVSVTVIGNGQSYTGQISNPSDPITVADNHSPVVYTAISFAICFVISVGIIVLLVIVFYKILRYYKKKAKSKPTCSCSQNPASVQL